MLVLFALAPTGFAQLRDALASQLRFDNASVRTPELMLQRLSGSTAQALMVYLPLGLLVIALAVAALVAAGSFAFSTKPIEPKLSNISPLSGFKRLFSRQQVIETFKLVGITAVVLVAYATWMILRGRALSREVPPEDRRWM